MIRIGTEERADTGRDRSPARVRRAWLPRVGWPEAAVSWLALAVGLIAARTVRAPTAGLDPSWMTGINVAAGNHVTFGRSLLFTYGPWGFLDNPLTVSRGHVLLGVLFAALAVGMVFHVVHLGVRPHLNRTSAGAVAAAVAVTVWSPGAASFLLLSAIAALAVRFLRGELAYARWFLPVIAAGSALLIQIKFSEGLALAAIVTVTALCSSTSTIRSLVVAAGSCVGAFVLTWSAVGQSRHDLWPWVTGSVQIASGYVEAMAIEIEPNLLSYLLAAACFGVFALLAVRSARALSPRPGVGVLLVAAGSALFAFKQGFTRHDGHELAYFTMIAVLTTALLPRVAMPKWGWPALGMSVLLAASAWSNLDPISARDDWKQVAQTLLDKGYQDQELVDAGAQARQTYALPPSVIDVARGRPVTVDPWEVTLAWAYSFDWRPVPVLQTYSAYTADLDGRNATAAEAASNDQVVIRSAVPVAIDSRNPLWESPRYTLALACHYQPVAGDARWVALTKAANRCSAPTPVSRQRMQANEPVALPKVQPGKVLLASFDPDNPSLMARLIGLVLKPYRSLIATTDGTRHRLPTGLADGPLIVGVPGGTGLTGTGDSGVAYSRLAFNEPGQLTLRVLDRR
jgi:hypothetical protein